MKGKVRLKSITIFLIVAGVHCDDFLDQLKSSLEKLQNSVDKISLDQNERVDQLEEKIENIFDAIDQLKNEVKILTQEKQSENVCNEIHGNQNRKNLTEDNFEALYHASW